MRAEVEVNAPPERAFDAFTGGLSSWWPAEYTWAQSTLEGIAIEPKEGGRCHETGPHGFSCDWGRVLACEPPQRLVFTWQISPDRTPQPDPEGEGYRDALASEPGWPFMLDCLKRSLA